MFVHGQEAPFLQNSEYSGLWLAVNKSLGNYSITDFCGLGIIYHQESVQTKPGYAVSVKIVKLNGGRHVIGVLRGFDPFMNLVMDESIEKKKNGDMLSIGMIVIRGNSIVLLEALDRIS